ncbi:ABC transporter substrate-binding protein [Devosia sp. SL43]|uniref:ABC transporter substrate-binding protein n=1 Tax=Devosia sp. SL43 TaxID=2806348 RepID=UPI001F22D718|nr:ABC transporter substrate-binding protein [Devosia sp. SL43]UJW87403.1 ABC transporter substrate-binding protein [Devosia sp. SL43]
MLPLSRLIPLAFMLIAVPVAAQDFPQVFEHKFGVTTLDEKPVRVVSLSYLGQDHFLSLGVHPVGVRTWYGDYPYGAWPWAQAALGDSQPQMIGDLNYEQIAMLEPDVIEAVWAGITAEEYVELSKIAPVVATGLDYADYGTPWQVITKTFGRIVGEQEQAEALVTGIDQRFADSAAAHPEWQGKTAAIAWVGDTLGAYRSNDVRSQMMAELGFVTPAVIDASSSPEDFVTDLSMEQTDVVDADVVIWFNGEDDPASVKGLALRDRMRAHVEGREIFAGKQLSGAFSYASPLSINSMLDKLVPEIELAIDGDPTTVVTTAKEYGLLD